MIDFYYHPSPNPAKVALFLEESGMPYDLKPVDTRKGEQHSAEYKAINPNAKTPAIVDGGTTILTAMQFPFTWPKNLTNFSLQTRRQLVARCCPG